MCLEFKYFREVLFYAQTLKLKIFRTPLDGPLGSPRALDKKVAKHKKLLEFDCRASFMKKCQIPNNPTGSHLFRSQYSGPKPKNQNSTPFFRHRPEVSKKICHVTVGQKLREKIDFKETVCFLGSGCTLEASRSENPVKKITFIELYGS
jgi:hypothetical protein